MAEINSRTFLDAVGGVRKQIANDLHFLNNRISATSSSIDKLTIEIEKMSKSTTVLGTKANLIAGLCAIAAIAQAVAAVAAWVKST